ncbi:unnamed protein product [Aureobasidium vineae]|uniref:Pre-mRNA-splicing factor 38B n=1 Tax=Aureobasidium vineae TaxID=2773715 RepID=A0A9N8JFQ3_9PEZI|nr:unnamed protein product [Aureobasidium vineae]
MPASGNDDITDDYVTEMLKRDAKALSSSSSLASLMNKRNILRHTDNHNSALLKKEAEESRLRLQNLPRSHRPAQQLYSARDRHNPKRRRLDPDDHDHLSTEQKTRESHRHSPDTKPRHSRSSRRDTSPDRHSSQRHHRDRRSPDSRHHESSRRHHHSRHRSSSPRNRHSSTKPSKSSENSTHRHNRRRSPPSDASDSDPLDAIIGPAPPSHPPVRSRGRGAQNHASAIDNHFSSNYDPSADVQPDPQEDDDWDQALEALRDRQKWKQQGADRLRAAGFTEKEVSKWEKGGGKSEEDVVWAKKGEGREWDRGKVVDEHGLVEVKPEWGRLKDA